MTKLFLKSKWKELLCYIVSMSIFAGILFLCNVQKDAVEYGLLLAVIFYILGIVLQFARFKTQHNILKNIEATLEVGMDRLPDTSNQIELDYQNIVRKLERQNGELKSHERIFRQEMTDYYGMWVHQIKTPIAAMHVIEQTLEEEYPEQKNVKELKLELLKIEQYVEMVLTYLRMEDMAGDLQIERCALDRLIKQAVRKYSQMFIYRRIQLQYRPVSKMILTDEKWLQFVLEQILSNALKYTNDGGRISIYTKEKEGQDWLVIEDNGIGIQAEDLPRVFEKGFTGYNGREDKKSTGIGLYMCQKIMERLNHRIWIESEVDRGTKVYLGITRKDWTIE